MHGNGHPASGDEHRASGIEHREPGTKHRARWLWAALRVGITVSAMVLVLHQVNLNETMARLRAARIELLLVVMVILQVGMVVRARRWQVLLEAHGVPATLGRLTALNYIGEFFGQFLPTGFGGDVVRIAAFGEGRLQTVAGASIVDRMAGLMTLFGMALVTMLFNRRLVSDEVLIFTTVVAGVGLLSGLLILEGRLVRRLIGWLPGPLSLRGEGWLAEMYGAVTGCGWRALGQAALLSLVYNCMLVFNHYLIGRAYGVETVPLGLFAAFVPVVVTTLLLPSVQGWGVSQGVYVPLLTSVGVSAETALALSVTATLCDVLTGLVGGLIFVLPARQRSLRSPPP
jgi:uncharacterized membrane protein YbhN (UPF0104 family)